MGHVAGGGSACGTRSIFDRLAYILFVVAKHLIDLDEEALGAARAELGTATIKDTVNEALRRATDLQERRVRSALDVLADAYLADRADAWR